MKNDFLNLLIGVNVYAEGAGYDMRHRPLIRILGVSRGAQWSKKKQEWIFPVGAYTELIDKAPGLILGRHSRLPLFWEFRHIKSPVRERNPGDYVYRYNTYKYVGKKVGVFNGWLK